MLFDEVQPLSKAKKKHRRNDWDNAWKEIIQQLLPAFLEFLFPRIYVLIDWSQEPVFLEQELRQATRRAKLKKMVLDDKREARFDAELRTIEEKHQMPTLPPRQVRLIARNRQEAELEGELKGQLNTLRTDIADVLEIRFEAVPVDITEQLNQIDDVSHLRILLRVAVRVVSIDEFRAQLS